VRGRAPKKSSIGFVTGVGEGGRVSVDVGVCATGGGVGRSVGVVGRVPDSKSVEVVVGVADISGRRVR
jgi:hypothetical protein